MIDNSQNRNSGLNIIKQDLLVKSSCSIEQKPSYSHKNVKFNENQYDINYEKSMNDLSKGYSDRFLPVRKMPRSAKDLYNDNIQWREDDDQQQGQKQDNKNLTIAELYKLQILGAEPDKHFKQTLIESFQNNNLLKFSHKKQDGQGNQNKHLFSKKHQIQIPQEFIPSKSKKQRKINKIPTKVLDAPALYDDFYLNLVDWSQSNILAVGLSNAVYLWNANNAKVVRLLQLSSNDLITSTSWSISSNILALGTHSGEVQLWDVNKSKKISSFQGHTARIGAVAWNSNFIFASGSRDKNILIRDIRKNSDHISRLVGHKQQVCGLKWSFDQQQLASGGNDNKLNLWNMHTTTPVYSLNKHTAAVKALAWSPHQHGLLVSGGGTADRTIRFWNSISGQQTKCLNVGSQVCNLMFSKTFNQLVSTHGYSLNEINIWQMPKMHKIETLTGHTYRVLYLAMNPDGTTIVTGAGDQTLRFWNVFPKKQKVSRCQSYLSPDAVRFR